MTTLHIDKGMPMHWVVVHDDATWMVPVVVNGWRMRRRHLAPWRLGPPLDGPSANLMLRALGVPGNEETRP